MGIETTDKWYTHPHTPKPVCEHEGVAVLWNQGVHKDREVTANRPNIIIKNKKQKQCTLYYHRAFFKSNNKTNECTILTTF
jgi:hypothetical protein